ncbi:glycosyltransferase family 2 protein [Sphaerisporangium rhizosphaerae]|uniref:Glycosyltransferase family 2 protein n=1 Tax=Sphaerisporangium rhizosphaerae TaxID=2269375 RepID=A0ABW2NX21_9ACTN
MKVSVVIPAFNARSKLRLLLYTLAHSVLDPEDSFEVVVADDGSTDGTGEMVAELSGHDDLTYLYLPRTERSSRAAARNAAIAKATGELVVMVDADTVVGPAFLAEHVRYHRLRNDLVVIGARPDLGDGDFDEERLRREFAFDAMPAVAWGDPREKVLAEFSGNMNRLAICWHLLFSCNASVRVEHLRRIGGFDEAFLGWGLEDTDLGYRLRQAGLAFAFSASAVAYHQRRRGIDAGMYDDWVRNLAYMTAKHQAPEVAIQSIAGLAMNPAGGRIGWVEAMRCFEVAARALDGRPPVSRTYRLMVVEEDTVETAMAELAARGATSDLLIIDETRGAELSGPVQCMDTPGELLYFHRPSATRRAEILGRYPVAAR